MVYVCMYGVHLNTIQRPKFPEIHLAIFVHYGAKQYSILPESECVGYIGSNYIHYYSLQH